MGCFLQLFGPPLVKGRVNIEFVFLIFAFAVTNIIVAKSFLPCCHTFLQTQMQDFLQKNRWNRERKRRKHSVINMKITGWNLWVNGNLFFEADIRNIHANLHSSLEECHQSSTFSFPRWCWNTNACKLPLVSVLLLCTLCSFKEKYPTPVICTDWNQEYKYPSDVSITSLAPTPILEFQEINFLSVIEHK